jgi:hypothetical protein
VCQVFSSVLSLPFVIFCNKTVCKKEFIARYVTILGRRICERYKPMQIDAQPIHPGMQGSQGQGVLASRNVYGLGWLLRSIQCVGTYLRVDRVQGYRIAVVGCLV